MASTSESQEPAGGPEQNAAGVPTQRPASLDRLDALVAEHLKLHAHDPQKSLASLSSIGSVREDLTSIPDPELHASLQQVTAARTDLEDDPNRLSSAMRRS